MTQTRNAANLAYLQTRPLTPFTSIVLQFVVLCVAWSERHRTRKALAKLDDHMLEDVGLTRRQATKEAQRPFWEL